MVLPDVVLCFAERNCTRSSFGLGGFIHELRLLPHASLFERQSHIGLWIECYKLKIRVRMP